MLIYDESIFSMIMKKSEPRPISTAPNLSTENEINELKAEIENLKSMLKAQNPVSSGESIWPTQVDYYKQPYSGAKLTGLTKDRDKIGSTEEYSELPKPTKNLSQLEADFIRWGYCLVADAINNHQIKAQVDRMLDQAEAERSAGVAHMSHRGRAQLIFNMLPKGQVFRDLIALEENAAEQSALVETLLYKILGQGFYLGTAHGSIVHQGGGRQELHQDQGFVPLPHPPYPLYCLIIWCYSDFSLEEGGTYLIPGSHRDARGENKVRPETQFEALSDQRLLALKAPAGTCVLTDSRLLHSGGKRTATGTRLASRILYSRGMMRQQENQYLSVPRTIIEKASPKLKKLMGFSAFYGLGMVDGNTIDPDKPNIHVGELSMTRPEELSQDFDWKYTQDAKRLSELDWETYAEYKGERDII